MTQAAPPGVQPSPRFPKKQLRDMVEAISGVQAQWVTDRQAHWGQDSTREQARIIVGMQAYRSVGHDERRIQYDAQTGGNDFFAVGVRQFTMTLRAESLDPNLEAFDLLERVRFRLRGQIARSYMVPILSLRDVQPIVMLPAASSGGRSMSVGTMDVRFNLMVGADPMDPNEHDIIETVNAAEGGVIPGTLT